MSATPTVPQIKPNLFSVGRKIVYLLNGCVWSTTRDGGGVVTVDAVAVTALADETGNWTYSLSHHTQPQQTSINDDPLI